MTVSRSVGIIVHNLSQNISWAANLPVTLYYGEKLNFQSSDLRPETFSFFIFFLLFGIELRFLGNLSNVLGKE